MRARILPLVWLVACSDARPAPPAPPWTPAAVAHAGASTPPERADGCRAAVDAALAVLERGGDPVDAAVAGVVVLEDDPRFNAGTGSRVRIDGVSVQMDASVMRSTGEFGAVAGIEAVKNPVQVARLVLDTPHLLLAGDGATRFARAHGFAVHDPTTEATREAARRRLARLASGEDIPASWKGFDWRAAWNFERPLDEALAAANPGSTEPSSDTVGVVVRAADGRFAAALSTGGTTVTLRGRVGDVPIRGAGLYAGPHGAVANTGTGERIVEADLARWVHGVLARDPDAQAAAKRGVEQLAGDDIGVIAISATSLGAAASAPMAWAGRELGSDRWYGPEPR
jgi:isoaspartyl peptidase/L-asparaginase-like protein (Ntn-hydrolase superfamily)